MLIRRGTIVKISIRNLWFYWIGISLGSAVYGVYTGDLLNKLLDAPYWIALTILAIQFFGAGRE